MIFLGRGNRKFDLDTVSIDKLEWKNITEYVEHDLNIDHHNYTMDIIELLEYSFREKDFGIYDESTNTIGKFDDSGYACVYQMTNEEFTLFKLKFL